MRRFSNYQGFTLLEFVLYTGLSSIAMATLVTISATTLRARVLANIERTVQSNINLALDVIIQRVENAATIVTPASGTTSGIELTGQDVNLFPVSVSLQNGTLYLQKGVDPQEAITSTDVNVTLFTVTRMTDPIGGVQMKMQVETRNPASPALLVHKTAQTTVMLSY